ncbi:hypothetical protein [Aestuariispira insulae]|uniref:Uncharacterized protein n=1 Tax=Aestuariispira insulae TaxID=1461337 RepID=A0A3D9H3N4_9PROT|nr:hypothetical protein [Aestuariispira insulae]RED44123.1 hypothetical protein DFP90_11726 [Aestuariispira insulae]
MKYIIPIFLLLLTSTAIADDQPFIISVDVELKAKNKAVSRKGEVDFAYEGWECSFEKVGSTCFQRFRWNQIHLRYLGDRKIEVGLISKNQVFPHPTVFELSDSTTTTKFTHPSWLAHRKKSLSKIFKEWYFSGFEKNEITLSAKEITELSDNGKFKTIAE